MTIKKANSAKEIVMNKGYKPVSSFRTNNINVIRLEKNENAVVIAFYLKNDIALVYKNGDLMPL